MRKGSHPELVRQQGALHGPCWVWRSTSEAPAAEGAACAPEVLRARTGRPAARRADGYPAPVSGRRTWRACGGGAALALLLAGCGGSAPADVVLARLGGPPALDATPEVAVAALKLGTRSRHALRVDRGAPPLEVSLPAGATRLAFSTAWLAKAGSAGQARFRIALADAGDSPPLFEEQIAGDEVGAWHDHEVALAHRPAGPLRLRLRVEVSDGVAAWGSVSALGEAHSARPNVVLIDVDTLGAAYLSAFEGAAGVSPRIDAFLREGFDFRRAYAQYGNTLVSHASLFSARVPLRHGVYPGREVRPLRESLVATLAAAGYRTVAFTEGAFVSSNFGFSVGFDHYDDGLLGLKRQMAGGAEQTFDHAARWLAAHGTRERFFLLVHTYEVHAPYLPRNERALEVARRITPQDPRVFPPEVQMGGALAHNRGVKMLSPRDLARLRALYSAEIHTVDEIVGGFLDRLAALGLADDTVVVLTADHGDQFGEHGKVGHSESLHNRVLQVPLGFRGSGVARGTSDAPVQLVDVMPTLLDLLGLPPAADRDGRSLAPLLRGQTLAPAAAYSEQRSSRGECERAGLDDPCRLDRYAVQTQRFKLISSRVPPFERLYDLRADPLETRDVKEEHPEALAEHRALLDRYRALEVEGEDGAAGSGAAEIDADTLHRLRELGYLGAGP